MSGTGKHRQIVDTNDTLIGHKWAEAFEPEKNIYRVSALWLRNTKGEILLAQRRHTKKNGGGLWGPAVAGTLEHDETYEQNIIKEIQEEIGLSGLELKPGKKRYIDVGNRKYFCTYFYGLCDKSVSDFVLEDEVAAVKWVSEQNLLQDMESNPEKYVRGMASIVNEIVYDGKQ